MEQPPPVLETRAPEPETPSMTLPARLMNVFAIPGDVFDEVKKNPPSTVNWLVPTLLLIMVGWIGAYLIFSQPAIQQQVREMQDAVFQKMVNKGQMTQQMADKQREIGEMSARVGPYVGAVLVSFFSPFWWGLVFWFVGNKAFKRQFSFMKGVEVAGLANTISVLGSIVTTLLIISLGNMFASPSPALLVKNFDPQNPSHSLLAVANIATIWVLGVRSVGLARLSGVSFVPAAAWVFGVWATYTGFFMALGLAFRALFKL
jgi:hypothetical protein